MKRILKPVQLYFISKFPQVFPIKMEPQLWIGSADERFVTDRYDDCLYDNYTGKIIDHGSAFMPKSRALRESPIAGSLADV